MEVNNGKEQLIKYYEWKQYRQLVLVPFWSVGIWQDYRGVKLFSRSVETSYHHHHGPIPMTRDVTGLDTGNQTFEDAIIGQHMLVWIIMETMEIHK